MKKIDILLESLERLHPKYIDLSLKRIESLLDKLGNPHLKLPPCIHIAGTNGKGSTLSFIKNIMIESGYLLHAYTSPHLEKINERFFITNKIISDKILIRALKYVKKINNNKLITFYEITTATAFYLFNKYPANFLLLETGLGGKLDATNIINKSLLSIITPISFDHQEYLGKTLNQITNEKLGIIKKSSVVISSKQNIKVKKIIKKFTLKNKNILINFKEDWDVKITKNKYFEYKIYGNYKKYIKPSLFGKHQIYNASTAITAINYLRKIGYKFNLKKINIALKNTSWPGRLEKIKIKNLTIYLDGAHNVDGANSLKEFIAETKKTTWLILGMMNSKNLSSFLKVLKNNIQGIVAVKIPNQKNSYSNCKIFNLCKKMKIYCEKENNIKIALETLIIKHRVNQIIICGSLYLIGEIKKLKLMN